MLGDADSDNIQLSLNLSNAVNTSQESLTSGQHPSHAAEFHSQPQSTAPGLPSSSLQPPNEEESISHNEVTSMTQFEELKSSLKPEELPLLDHFLENHARLQLLIRDHHQSKIRYQTFVTQWILENYEVADPRERIARKIPFIHFVQFCLKYRIPIPSPTSFGRFVTSAYPRVKRSRLGKRTDVQYVYLGLRQRVLPLPETVAQPTTPTLLPSNACVQTPISDDADDSDVPASFRQSYLTVHTSFVRFIEDKQWEECLRHWKQSWEELHLHWRQHFSLASFQKFIVSTHHHTFDAWLKVLFPRMIPVLQEEELIVIREWLECCRDCLQAALSFLPFHAPNKDRLQKAFKRFTMAVTRCMGIHQWARVMASLLQGELERARLRKALQDLDLDQLHLSLAWLHGAVKISLEVLLNTPFQLEQWIAWLSGHLQGAVNLATESDNEMQRRFVRNRCLRFLAVLSMMEKQLALRGSKSFGAFQVLRNWMDDFYLYQADKFCDPLA